MLHPIVGMAAEQGVDPGHRSRQLHVLREAEVGEDHHEVHSLLLPQARDMTRQLLLAQGQPDAGS